MLEIILEYKDDFTTGNWNRLECKANTIQEALQSFGLVNGTCDYRIITVIDTNLKQNKGR